MEWVHIFSGIFQHICWYEIFSGRRGFIPQKWFCLKIHRSISKFLTLDTEVIFISISIKRNILNYIHATFTSERLKHFLSFDSQMKQNVTSNLSQNLLTTHATSNEKYCSRIQETKWQIGFPWVWKCRQLRMHLGIRINLAVKEETEMQQRASKAKAWNSETKIYVLLKSRLDTLSL